MGGGYRPKLLRVNMETPIYGMLLRPGFLEFTLSMKSSLSKETKTAWLSKAI